MGPLPGSGDTPNEMAQAVPRGQQGMEAGRGRAVRRVGFASEDWNQDYTRWPAKPVFSKEPPFAGGASATLAWMQTELFPVVEQEVGIQLAKENKGIMGYSLAGLFALWGFVESGSFGAVASCSGSLWYDGWLEYLEKQKLPENSHVYFSLGEKEEKTRNPRMAVVGDMTRRTERYLRARPEIGEVALAWHPGGHFANAPERMAAALVWLAKV